MFAINILFLINLIIKNKFDKLTKYNDVELHYMPSKFTILYMFFGFIMIFFHKKVKEYRKRHHMKNYIRQMEWLNLTGLNYGITDDRYNQKYKDYKRYLKIKKLQKKSFFYVQI